jgi:arabinogalactan oligomer/maltooligosaccharide transport system permease protein
MANSVMDRIRPTKSDADVARPQSRMPRRRWFAEVGWRHVVGVVAVIWALFPVLYIVSAAFNPLGTVMSTGVIPEHLSLTNFHRLFTDPNIPFPRWALNTVEVAVSVVAVQLFFSALAAFAFSRLRFRGRRGGLLTLLLVQMFPQFLAAVALYGMFTDIGDVLPRIGLDTIAGYILVMCGGSLGQVWLIKGFFDSIPRSLDEAAMIDGASHAQTFFRIILPLARPVLAVCGLLVFIGVIQEFLLASIFLRSMSSKTLAVGLYGLINHQNNNLGVFAAGALLTALPVVVLFIWLQRFIVSGITAGAAKG